MKNRLAKNIQHGFTLVELLVVIGILGILAAALLAVIDPIEQLNKASDQSKKNIAVEYVGAMQRYYATKQAYPMATTGIGGTGCGENDDTDQNLLAITIYDDTQAGAGAQCTDDLISEGELKGSFTGASQANLDAVTISKDAGNVPFYACFLPSSKAYKTDAGTRFDTLEGGTSAGTCPDTDKSGDVCYWCAQ